MKVRFLAVLASLLAAPAIFSAKAGLADDSSNVSYLTPYVGMFDVTQQDDQAGQFGLEYRFQDVFYGLRPTLGAYVTSNGGQYYYGGGYWDIKPHDNFYIAPNIVAGYYENGGGKKLHYPLEFRSGLEIGYEFDSKDRIGVAFNHTSNARLGDDNPGTESLMLTYGYPIF